LGRIAQLTPSVVNVEAGRGGRPNRTRQAGAPFWPPCSLRRSGAACVAIEKDRGAWEVVASALVKCEPETDHPFRCVFSNGLSVGCFGLFVSRAHSLAARLDEKEIFSLFLRDEKEIFWVVRTTFINNNFDDNLFGSRDTQ
jgi:hypothetical protein